MPQIAVIDFLGHAVLRLKPGEQIGVDADEVPAPVDARIGDRAVEIVPNRPHEFRLAEVELFDARIERDGRGRAVVKIAGNSGGERLGAEGLEEGAKPCRGIGKLNDRPSGVPSCATAG